MKKRRKNNRDDTSAKKRFANSPAKEKKDKTVGTYKGIPYESMNELWFLQWASELQKLGYIRSIKRAEPYMLTNGFTISYAESTSGRGVSSRVKEQVILRPSLYTPEFKIVWNKNARDKIVWCSHGGSSSKFDKALMCHHDEHGELYSIIECKGSGSFDFNNMTRLFKSNQKFVWDKYQVYINLVKPHEFFEKTFCPEEFMITPTGRQRKINFQKKTVYEFLNS